MSQVGQISGLGHGEQIYSVRFVANAGYVVTFRRVDPLYTLALSDPSAPRVVGKLELEGYSSYLHPLGNGLLLGVGNDVGATNEPSGGMLELFDVSVPASPRLLAKTTLGAGSSTPVQYDHHAFLYWPATGLAVLPVEIDQPVAVGAPVPVAGAPTVAGAVLQRVHDRLKPFTGAIGFTISPTGIAELGRISHDPIDGYTPQIERAVVVGTHLYTLSQEGLMASDLATLARQSFVAFPQPPPPAPTCGPVGVTGSGRAGAGVRGRDRPLRRVRCRPRRSQRRRLGKSAADRSDHRCYRPGDGSGCGLLGPSKTRALGCALMAGLTCSGCWPSPGPGWPGFSPSWWLPRRSSC